MTDLNVPLHICIIPDGNRRWAKEKGLPSLAGHQKGADNFDPLVQKARDLGVKCLTAWLFSTENWKRPQEETDFLFKLVRDVTKKYKAKCVEEKIRFVHLGRKDRLPNDIVAELIETETLTQEFTSFTIALGLDYGGHDEMLRCLQKLKDLGLEATAENIEAHLDTCNLPRPDLIIRTSGEIRLSGFMSWQSEYAEFYFPKMHFPDFGPAQLEEAIKDFSVRDRRFGGNSTK
jgi:undecaprenyl diphosphate synthase